MSKDNSSEATEQDNTAQEDATKSIPAQGDDISPEVTNDISAVASSRKKGMLILIFIGAVFLGLLKNLYTGVQEDANADKMKTEKVETPKQVTLPTNLESGDLTDTASVSLPKVDDIKAPDNPPAAPTESKDTAPEAPQLPRVPTAPTSSDPKKSSDVGVPELPASLPPIDSASPAAPASLPPIDSASPAAPAALPAMPTTPSIVNSGKSLTKEQAKRRKARLKSSITLVGGVEAKTAEEVETSADFKKRGKSEFLLSRGKIVDAILETAINTNFGGEVRAIISRNVYSDSGRLVLIPKGSRVFGSYTNAIDQNYGKIDIKWNRIDLPTGYSLTISSPTIDGLGRTGIIGRLDNKQMEKISNSVMTSALNVVLAGAVDKLVKPPSNVTASNQNTETINTIRTISNAVAYDTNIDNPQTKMLNICAQLRSSIADKTSSAYTQVDTQCNVVRDWSTDALKNQSFQAFILALNGITDSVTQSAASAAVASKEQDAAKKGYEDVSKVIKDAFDNENGMNPVITVDQGKAIKIYINKDYNFPKKAVSKSRIVR